MIQIDICIEKDKNTTEKGRILEHLVAKLLSVQLYEVVETIRVTGMEIDVLAKHKINNETILVECKAWDNPLPADVISKLLGNVMLRNVDKGWLVTTGPLTKDALGIKTEWEQKNDSDRKKLSFYTYDRVIEQLISTGIIVNSECVADELKSENLSKDKVLMITENNYYWIIPILNGEYNNVDKVVVFNACNGVRIDKTEEINYIKHLSNYYADATWIAEFGNIKNNSNRIEEEVNSIVTVIGGDDWEDYRPARP